MSRLWMQVVIILLTISVNTQARIYKSVDKDGNVTYSQTKPTDVEDVETIKTPKSPPAPPPIEQSKHVVEKDHKTAEGEDEPKELSEENQQIEAENAEIKKKNCEISKKKLGEINNAGRIKITGEDGNIKWASEEEIQARKEELQANVDKWCNG